MSRDGRSRSEGQLGGGLHLFRTELGQIVGQAQFECPVTDLGRPDTRGQRLFAIQGVFDCDPANRLLIAGDLAGIGAVALFGTAR